MRAEIPRQEDFPSEMKTTGAGPWEGLIRFASERGKSPKWPIRRVNQSQVPSGSRLKCKEAYRKGGEQWRRDLDLR